MTKAKHMALIAIVALVWCGVATAVENIHKGDMGNPEEPAMRPFKAIFNGLLAFKNQIHRAAKEGNDKLPILGATEVVRGVRRGTVEFAARTYQGMAGTYPHNAKKVGKTNEFLDTEPLLGTVADTAPAVAVFGLSGRPATTFLGSTSLLAVQKTTDKAPEIREKHRLKKEGKEAPKKSARAAAQERYIQGRAKVNSKSDCTGNLLKLAKK